MRSLAVILALGIFAGVAHGQTKARVYVDPKDSVANEFAAGTVKKEVPITITTDPNQVHYFTTFTWQTNEGSKAQEIMTTLATGIYMSGSFERVSMTIFEAKTRNIVFSYTC
jgi:hypothetical protein